jgi:hypothetical protein
MAARLNKKHQDDVRLKIQTSQLVNRLQGFALGSPDPKTGNPMEIDPTRLRAIEILLRKSLPDLSNVNVELTGEDGGPVQIEDTGARDKLAAIVARLSAT